MLSRDRANTKPSLSCIRFTSPPSPYAPYYYSAWNPYSLYSIYDHLSGGRQLCRLPSEPCDNEHRVQN
jgi:hypothetical protein